MKRFLAFASLLILFSCDKTRVYEQQVDLPEKAWLINNQPHFDFEIKNHTLNYNIYYTVRNSLEFPYSRIFVNYTLKDSSGVEIRKALLSAYLFDQKTGKPEGDSGLGDLFDHRFPIVTDFHFDKPGIYSITFEQFNRQDTLQGVLAIGVRVETTTKQ